MNQQHSKLKKKNIPIMTREEAKIILECMAPVGRLGCQHAGRQKDWMPFPEPPTKE